MARNGRRRPQTNVDLRGQQLFRYNLYYTKWISYIEKLMLSRVKWNNLPDTIDERFLERVLMRYGKAVFYSIDDLFLATRVMTTDQPDLYDNYHRFQSIGTNWNYTVPEGEGVLIWDSMTRRPYYDLISTYAEDLAELEQTAHLNRRQQRWAVIITGDEVNLRDRQRILQEIETGQPVILGSNTNANLEVKKVDLTVPYLAADFHDDKAKMLSELYLQLGIINIPKDKPQYMNLEETGIANDAVSRIREDILIPRKQACDAINDMYGLDISVEWRTEEFTDIIRESEEEPETEKEEEGKEND